MGDWGGIAFLLGALAAFVAVVVWVFLPRRKARLDARSRIPLEDEPVEPRD